MRFRADIVSRNLLCAALVCGLGLSASLLGAQQAVPHPQLSADLAVLLGFMGQPVSTPTLVFLSEDQLAVGGCSGKSDCRLAIVQVSDQGLRSLHVARNWIRGSLLPAPEGRVLSAGNFSPGVVVYSSDLSVSAALGDPLLQMRAVSSTGSTFAPRASDGTWEVYRIDRPAAIVRKGAGDILAVSDDAIAIREGDLIRLENMDGKPLGSFRAKPATKCFLALSILGPASANRLLVEECTRLAVRDYHGAQISALPRLDGWGHRVGQSRDGSRILFDRYIRQVSALRNAAEIATALATLGVGVADQTSNGEVVAVVDGTSGRRCFEWHGAKDVGTEGDFHADIAPSGAAAAIVTKSRLLLYRLPESCSPR